MSDILKAGDIFIVEVLINDNPADNWKSPIQLLHSLRKMSWQSMRKKTRMLWFVLATTMTIGIDFLSSIETNGEISSFTYHLEVQLMEDNCF